MVALAGKIEEWEEFAPRCWRRAGHPEDGTVALREGLSFVEYWGQRQEVEPAPRRQVSRLTVVKRLDALGLLGAAEKLMAEVDPLTRQRWNATSFVYADDLDTLEFLEALGADPEYVLAEGEAIARPPGRVSSGVLEREKK